MLFVRHICYILVKGSAYACDRAELICKLGDCMRRWLLLIVLALATLPAIANAQDRSFVRQRIESDVMVQGTR